MTAAEPTVGTTTEPALRVTDLTVVSPHSTLLRGLTFDIQPGERVGLIGESGSGKSLTATAVMGLLPHTLNSRGSIHLTGTPTNLLQANEETWGQLRGNTMSMVFQEPMTALNPLMRVGDQIAEVMTQHKTYSRAAAVARAITLLEQVQLPDPAQTARAYPHQLSGGQRQRVMLAIAMANEPRLLICDEPTTALDVTVQAGILSLIDTLVRDRGSSLLFITHDIGVVAAVCDRVLVMHKGEIVEDAPLQQILTAPQHPYTRSLIAASDLGTPTATPTADATAPGHPTTRPGPRATAAQPALPALHEHLQSPNEQRIFLPATGEALIEVRGLSRDYRRGVSLFGGGPVVPALRDVSFDVVAGQRLGIVGESGSGKSTLLRLLCALDTPTAGTVTMSQQRISGASVRQLTHFRSEVQMVFQDPGGSLDPRMRVEQIVAEPLSGVDRSTAKDRVIQALTAVGLEPDVLRRHPHQFSGGQRQRISIARALITRPKVLIADEAVSALDVSVRAEVLALLDSLVADYSLTLIFVSHDLGVIRRSCDTVAVLSKGRIVEAGPTEDVYTSPRHAYTRQLVDAASALADGMHGAAGMHRVAGSNR